VKRKPSTAVDNVFIALEFDRYGWSRFRLNHDKTSVCYRVSDVFSDFVAEMLMLCEHVLKNEPVRIALCDEPGGAVIALAPNASQHHIVRLTIEDIHCELAGFEADATGPVALSIDMKRKHLFAEVFSQIWKTRYLLKEPSYQRERVVFPEQRLIDLNRAWDESNLGPSFLK